MTKVSDIYQVLCEIAPPALQLDFDNAGFLVGCGDAEVKTVLLALDITDEVITEAVRMEAQLIVSHHPVIFHPLRSVTAEGEGALVYRLVREGLSAVCMHTNLDIVSGGVNDVLLEKLGAACEGSLDADGCGRFGILEQALPLPAFLEKSKELLGVNVLRYVDGGKPVHRIAVMGGAGGDAFRDAISKGCDTYVTADVKYHQFLDAKASGLTLIDADHFCTENPVISIVADKLRAAFPAVQFVISGVHRQTVCAF